MAPELFRVRSNVTLPTASARRPLMAGTSWFGFNRSLNTGVAEREGLPAVGGFLPAVGGFLDCAAPTPPTTASASAPVSASEPSIVSFLMFPSFVKRYSAVDHG